MSLLWKVDYEWLKLPEKHYWHKVAHELEVDKWVKHYILKPRFRFHKWYLRKFQSRYFT